MRTLKLASSFLALAAIGALLTGGASGQTGAGILAKDNVFESAAGGAASITIAAGDAVMFSLAGSNPHNVRFTGAQPTSCAQSVGTSSGSVPPLPNPPSSSAWEGKCTFTAPGSYPFVCEIHGNMTGTVAVSGATTPPPPPPPPPPVSPAPPPAPPPPPAAPLGPAATQLRVINPQRGTSLRGSVNVRSASSRLLARAFARRGALSGGRSTLQVQVGRQSRPAVGPGRVAFSVPLNAVARRALRRNGRLAIVLRLTVDPPSGTTWTASRTVILRAPL